jgi:hypothetical protein
MGWSFFETAALSSSAQMPSVLEVLLLHTTNSKKWTERGKDSGL